MKYDWRTPSVISFWNRLNKCKHILTENVENFELGKIFFWTLLVQVQKVFWQRSFGSNQKFFFTQMFPYWDKYQVPDWCYIWRKTLYYHRGLLLQECMLEMTARLYIVSIIFSDVSVHMTEQAAIPSSMTWSIRKGVSMGTIPWATVSSASVSPALRLSST